MRTSRLLSAASLFALLALQPALAQVPDDIHSRNRIVVAMDNMNMQPSGGMGSAGSPPSQGSPGMSSSGGMSMMCCGMGGMQQGSSQPAMGQGSMQQNAGQSPMGQGSMQQGSSGQMGGMGMMNNMSRMPGQSGSMPSGSAPMSGMSGMNDNMRSMQPSPMGGMQGGSGGMGGMGMSDDNMRRMQQNQAMPGMAANGVDMTDRIDGRIAFLRAELKVTEPQTALWNQFAEALRSSRQHLIEARQLLAAPQDLSSPTARLEQYERHLTARLEAIRTARTSFAQLYAALDEHQKHVANELVIPFLATF